jgi:hypothetical protein
MFTPIGFAPGVPAEYYESIGQQSLADRLREAQAASNPVAPLSNADLLASASRAASHHSSALAVLTPYLTLQTNQIPPATT